MMSDVAVMPQLAQALPKAAPLQRTTTAMQKAATSGDAPATPTASTPSKPATDKSSDQPMQFIDLLMAQLDQPTEPQITNLVTPDSAAQLAVAAPDPALAQNTQALISQTITPALQVVQPVTMDANIQPSGNEASPLLLAVAATSQPALAPQTTPSNTAIVPQSTGKQTAPAPQNAQTNPPAVIATQTPVTAALTSDTTNLTKLTDTTTSPKIAADSTVNSSVTVASQTPATTALTNNSTDSANLPDVAPSAPKKSIQATSAAKVTTSAVVQKPAFDAQMATKEGAKPSETSKTAQQLLDATPATPHTVSSNSVANLYNMPQLTPSTPQLSTTDTAALAQSSPPQYNSAIHLKLISDKLLEGIRSAGGSDRTITLNLNPPELGRVHLRMQDDGAGRITAVLKVENVSTRADIEQALPSMIRSLEQSGIQIRRMDVVSTDPVPQDSSSGRQGDLQGGMPNQRNSQDQSAARQTSPSATGTWQNLQPVAAADAPVSVVSDSAINIYM